MAPDETRSVTVDGSGVFVARGQDGEYYAVERLRSHAALRFGGRSERSASIVCPHHGARFELKSGRVPGPPAYLRWTPSRRRPAVGWSKCGFNR